MYEHQVDEVSDGSERDEAAPLYYNGDQIPPNFNISNWHRLASRVGNEEQDLDDKLHIRCPCCQKAIERKQLKMFCGTKQLSFLGSGMPQYFDFYKYCVIILVTLFSTSGDYNLITNIAFGNNCQDQPSDDQNSGNNQYCQANLANILSLANKRYDTSLLNLQQMLNLVSIIMVIVLLQYFRKSQRELDIECDAKTVTASDFTIMVKNIPTLDFKTRDCNIESELKHFFTDYMNDNVPMDEEALQYIEMRKKLNPKFKVPPRVQSVNLCYNLHELNLLQEHKAKLVKSKQNYLNQAYKTRDPTDPQLEEIDGVYADSELNLIQQAIDGVDSELKQFRRRFYDGVKDEQFFLGWAFVTFQWESDQNIILEMNTTTTWTRFFGQTSDIKFQDNYLVIEAAPEPDDINWQNLHITNKQKLIRRSLALVLSIAVLFLSSWSILYIYKLQHELQAGKDSIVKKLSKLSSVLIIALNYVLSYIIKKASEFEGYSTVTGYHISFATISTYAQFTNSALVSWLVTAMFLKNYYDQGGLVSNQTYIFASNMIIPPILLILDPGYIYKTVMRELEKRKQMKSVMTQDQLNQLYEDPQESLSDRYASILKTMYMTAFYASIIPIGILMSCISLIIIYWISKYNILRRRIFKNSYGSELSVEMTENLEIVLPIYCFSNFWFEFIFTEGAEVSTYAIIGIAIGIINAVLPMQELNIGIFHVKEIDSGVRPYGRASLKMEIDYPRANPATADRAKEEFITRKQKHRKIKHENPI